MRRFHETPQFGSRNERDILAAATMNDHGLSSGSDLLTQRGEMSASLRICCFR